MVSDCEHGPADDECMDMLAEHVPLSLIMDIAGAADPKSADILAAEGRPEVAWWEQPGCQG